jgi:hypothetical protein
MAWWQTRLGTTGANNTGTPSTTNSNTWWSKRYNPDLNTNPQPVAPIQAPQIEIPQAPQVPQKKNIFQNAWDNVIKPVGTYMLGNVIPSKENPFVPQSTTDTFNAMRGVSEEIGKAAEVPGSAANKFWTGKGGDFLASIQKKAETYKPIKVVNVSDKINNPVGKFVVSIPEGMANSAFNIVTMRSPINTGITTGTDIRTGEINNPKVYFSDMAMIGKDILDAYIAGGLLTSAGKTVVKSAGKAFGKVTLEKVAESTATNPGFWRTVGTGALRGTEFGGTYGFLGGVQQGRDIPDNKDYASNLFVSTISNAVAGGAVGATLSAGQYGINTAFNKLFISRTGTFTIKGSPEDVEAYVKSKGIENTPLGQEMLSAANYARQNGNDVGFQAYGLKQSPGQKILGEDKVATLFGVKNPSFELQNMEGYRGLAEFKPMPGTTNQNGIVYRFVEVPKDATNLSTDVKSFNQLQLETPTKAVVPTVPEVPVTQPNAPTVSPQVTGAVTQAVTQPSVPVTTASPTNVPTPIVPIAPDSKAIINLKNNNIPVTPINEAVENIRMYMQTQGDTAQNNYISESITDNTIKTLEENPIGVNELKYDNSGNITLYRSGNTVPGKPNSFSIEQGKGQEPYIINKDEILINTTGKDIRNLVSSVYKDLETAKIYLNTLDRWNKLESEVIAVPKEILPTTEVIKPAVIEKGGKNLMEIENADLTLSELKQKLTIAQEGKEDADLIKQMKKEIYRLEGIHQANPALFNKAQKAVSLDAFLKSMGVPSPTIDEQSLTNFYNKVKGTTPKKVTIGTKEVSGKVETKDVASFLKDYIGDIFTVQKPVHDLWVSKDNVLYISQNRERQGFIDWLRKINFIENAQEAGNNVVKITFNPSMISDLVNKPKVTIGTTKTPKLTGEILQKGTYYRGGGEGLSLGRGSTAQDIIDYEQKELGNKDVVAVKGIDLTKIPASKTLWVTNDKEYAKDFGKITKQDFGEHRIIATDGFGGYLVDYSMEKPMEVTTVTKKGLTLAPTKAKPGEETLAEARRLGVETSVKFGSRQGREVGFRKPIIGKTEFKTIVKNSPEFRANPTLTVVESKDLNGDTRKLLVFNGKRDKFKIVPTAMQLNPDNLKVGDKIKVDVESLKAVGTEQQMRVFKGGSALADVGGYVDREKELKDVFGESYSKIKPIAMPEIVQLAKELSGNTPEVKNFRKKALGYFQGGKIALRPEIFKDPFLASRVLAHEIGHLTDWLPDFTLSRGNELGRIATLTKNMKGSIGELDDVKNKELRTELKGWTQYWKPFKESEVSDSYKKYRYSSVELYADALSGMFNDPMSLKIKAPKFYDSFFRMLDRKPIVEEAFSNLQTLINAEGDTLYKHRDELLNKAYKDAEAKFVAKELEHQQRKTSVWMDVRTLFDSKNAKIIDDVRKSIKKGDFISDAKNPEYLLEDLQYIDSYIKNKVEDLYQPVKDTAMKVEDGWTKLGKVLQLERAINERGEMANPGGYDPKTAQEQLDYMKRSMSNEDWSNIQSSKEAFRKATQELVNIAEKEGFYRPEMIAEMKANPAYATFQVIDYLDTYVSPSIHKQLGTLKDIANPATSSVIKAVSLLRAIERNTAKKATMDYIKEFHPDEMKEAKTKWNGKSQQIVERKEPGMELVIIRDQGKLKGYYVDPYIARGLNNMSDPSIKMMSGIMRAVSGASFYRPLFTSVNLGFQTYNLTKDFLRYWKNLPDETLGQAIKSFPKTLGMYKKAIAPSWDRSTGQRNALIKEMEDMKVLGLTYNDIAKNFDPEDAQIERTLQRVGLGEPKDKSPAWKKPFIKLWDGLELLGNFAETLPKVAGYTQLKGKLPERELTHFVRTRLGSPNFRETGVATPVTNSLFLFSNAMKEGIKTDLGAATEPKTKSGYWFKTFLVDFMPKILMALAAYGIFGKKVKDIMDSASEYDKTNYTVVPIGTNKNGKGIYMRVPHDETGRLLSSVLWKFLNAGNRKSLKIDDLAQVMSIFAGQVPSLSPSFTSYSAIMQYLSGNNPYDTFRGRNIISDKAFAAGVRYSLPEMANWLIQNQGGGIIIPNYTPQDSEMTNLQKLLSLPVLSNILGRWIKVSDYGKTEQLREVTAKVAQEKAIQSIEEDKKIENAFNEYKKSDKSNDSYKDIATKMIEDIFGKPLSEIKGDDVTKANNSIKKLNMTIIKGRADPNVNALISAPTNDAKAELLVVILPSMKGKEASDFIKQLIDEKIITPDVLSKYAELQK